MHTLPLPQTNFQKSPYNSPLLFTPTATISYVRVGRRGPLAQVTYPCFLSCNEGERGGGGSGGLEGEMIKTFYSSI